MSCAGRRRRSKACRITPRPPQLRRRSLLLGSGAWLTALQLPACTRAPRTPDVDVAVLGAGFAGLAATRLLRKAGVHTVLLEGSDRVGGRVHTLYELAGAPEGGAIEIGHSYRELLQLCREFGVPVQEGVRLPGGVCLHVRGQLLAQEDWPASAANQLSASERELPPPSLLRHYLPAKLPVESLDFWGDPAYARVDISLAGYLRGAGASPEAIRLVAANLNGHDIERLSWADLLKTLLQYRRETAPGTLNAVGGLGRVSEGLAREAGDSLQLGKKLLSIEDTGRRFHLRCADGTGWRARVVICTLPFSTLRQLRLLTSLNPGKTRLIQNLQYTPATRVFFRPLSEFWQSDGLSASMWTDTPLGRVFLLPPAGGQRWMVAFSISKGAQMLDRMIAEDPRAPLSLMAKIRPASARALEIARVVSWGSNPMARGAFSHYSAGEVSRDARWMAQPEGRLLFAGEHTEVQAPGMEGALVSGRRTAREALHILRRS